VLETVTIGAFSETTTTVTDNFAERDREESVTNIEIIEVLFPERGPAKTETTLENFPSINGQVLFNIGTVWKHDHSYFNPAAVPTTPGKSSS
jgi:hypothetical protein